MIESSTGAVMDESVIHGAEGARMVGEMEPFLPETIMGLDLGDKHTEMCALSRAKGEILEQGRIQTTPAALAQRFRGVARMLTVIEVGTHSPWVDELLESLGHEVLVANARQVALIHKGKRKNDKVDAEKLARLGRVDPKLLAPIRHRGREARKHLAIPRARGALNRTRTKLINHCRGAVKSFGERLPKCGSEAFPGRAGEVLPEPLRPALDPLLEVLAGINVHIREYDKQLGTLAKEIYPEHELLTQVPGVGVLTAMVYILTLEDKDRFSKSRSVGAYLGLVPGQDDSGNSTPQKGITKEGDKELRRLMVQSAQYNLGPFGKDSDLRRHGLKIAERGGKNAKKRAAVAVARKIAILLHHLWRTGEVYEPLHNARKISDAGPDEAVP